MDANEDAATTAVRELREETGYAEDVTVRSVSPVLVKDPGMSGANMHLVTLDVRPPTDAPPTPQLEVGEHIVTRLVPLKDIQAVLDGQFACRGTRKELTVSDYAKRGFAIDALLQSIVTGLALAA